MHHKGDFDAFSYICSPQFAPLNVTLIKSISGIRGTIGGVPGENLTPIDIVKFSSAFGSWINARNPGKGNRLVIGRDARISGAMVHQLVTGTLNGMEG